MVAPGSSRVAGAMLSLVVNGSPAVTASLEADGGPVCALWESACQTS